MSKPMTGLAPAGAKAVGVSQDGTVITGNGFNTRLGMDEPWRAVLPLP